MKHLFNLLLTGLLVCCWAAHAQQPDHSHLVGDTGKIKACLVYCESLRVGTGGGKGNYPLLQVVSRSGLDMTAAGDHSDRSRFYFYMAFACYYQVHFDSAQYYFYQSLAEAQTAGSILYITNACVALIPVNYQLQQQTKTDSIKNLLLSIVDTTGNKEVLEDIYFALGSYYTQKSYYSTAQDFFLKSLALRKPVVDTTHDLRKKVDYAIQCYNLVKIYQDIELYDKALDVLKDGSRFMQASPLVKVRYLSAFTEIYSLLGNIDSALYYDHALDESLRGSVTIPSESVSTALDIGQYYIKRHQYPQSVAYVRKADSLATLSKSPILLYQAEMIRGQYLEETGRNTEAIAELTKALPVAARISKEHHDDLLKYLALAEKQLGNTSEALAYYEQYVSELDSLSKEKISRNFADVETRYETKEKEDQIVSLDRVNRFRSLELKDASHERLILIVGLLGLGTISILLYFIYRNKEKLNRQLTIANETKARLFSIIGHDLRSPVSKIVQLLRLQKERPDLLGPEARLQHDERLKVASENALETMEDLLLWSKSQMERFTPQFDQFKLLPLFQKEIALHEGQLEDKGLTISLDIPPGYTLTSDENFMTVIVRNLLHNAIKYSDSGSTIAIGVFQNRVHILNQSTSADAALLNERLAQSRVDSKGSGLGLQIAASLAKSIHASLHFQQTGEHSLTAVLTILERRSSSI